MKFNYQYSYPNDNRIAVSDWIEKQSIVDAVNLQDAKNKISKKLQHLGTWLILDIYPEQ